MHGAMADDRFTEPETGPGTDADADTSRENSEARSAADTDSSETDSDLADKDPGCAVHGAIVAPPAEGILCSG